MEPEAPPPAPPEEQLTVSTVLRGLSAQQLLELVTQTKMLLSQDFDQTRAILVNNGALCYTLLHALALLGVINLEAVQMLIANFKDRAVAVGVPAPPSAPVPMAEGAAGEIDIASFASTVLNLTPQQLEALTPEQREQIVQLLTSLGVSTAQGEAAFM